MEKVRKRNNKVVNYESKKIFDCIKKANNGSKDKRMNNTEIKEIISLVENQLEDIKIPSVEHIQDVVENTLMKTNHINTAKAYIIYRSEHAKIRDSHEDLMNQIMEVTFEAGEDSDYKRSNANIQSDSVMGTMLLYGTTVSNYFSDNYIIPKKFIEAHRAGTIHIHDKDFQNLAYNCLQADLQKILQNGFSTGHGHIREPQSIRSAASLGCIVIQSSQNDMFGGQSVAQWDRTMAIYVRKTFRKTYLTAIKELLEYADCEENLQRNFVEKISEYELPTYKNETNLDNLIKNVNQKFGHDYTDEFIKHLLTKAYSIACKKTEDETYQAMESTIHNFNSMHSRAGAQTPFSSLNFGTDTTPEGRLVTEKLLLAQEAGLGNGETSIFPITIFRLKEGINYNKDDVNYDLFKLACRVSAKRLYPNFESQDATFNMEYYDPNDYRTEIATMGCVEGTELITYKLNDKIYTEGIKRLWNRLESNKQPYSKISNYVNTTNIGLEIWDSEGFVPVKTVLKNDNVSNWLNIVFSNGRNLKCTTDHPLYTTTRGRIRADELNIKDKIKSFYTCPTNEYSDMSPEKAYALGVLITDETYRSSVGVRLGLDEIDIANKFSKCFTKVWNRETHIKEDCCEENGNYQDVIIDGDTKSLHDELVATFDGYLKIERRLPASVFGVSREARLACLAGMIDINGYISNSFVHVKSANKELALQQVALAQSLGYIAKIYQNNYSEKTPKTIHYCVEFAMTNELADTMASKKKVEKWNGITPDLAHDDEVTVVKIEMLENVTMDSYDVETESDKFICSFIQSGNCRTRTVSNINGPSIVTSRGNFSFTTINLPQLALKANRDIKKFFKLLDKTMKLCEEQLLWRLKLVGKRHCYNFPFLMGQHLWLDSENYKPTDEIKELLKHASISIGFCGLAEALVALVGQHHGESEEARELGYKIISHMREVTDKYMNETHLNFSLFASPAESTAGKFLRIVKKEYGIIKGVTDKEYFTNSFHCPVYYPINAFDKIKIEAPFHDLCNAGHISYVEMDGDPTKNLNAFEKVVRAMHDANMGYFSINHAVDRCVNCGTTTIINEECPVCGYKERINNQKIKIKLDNCNNIIE